ncbi:MAG: nucleotidyltransferase family protein [Anaerolineae bacterium]|nr:nucleotidyltransferase family protein [Anaerolineae bacterium]
MADRGEVLRAAVWHLWRYCRPFYTNDMTALSCPALRPLWPVLHYLAQGDGGLPMADGGLEEFRQPWAAAYTAAAGRSVLLSQELSLLLSALEEAGIPVVLLKGAILAKGLYPNPALRPMGDLDILVPREEMARLGALLEAIGYAWDGHCGPDKHRGYERQLGDVTIRMEAHWHLISEGYGLQRCHDLDIGAFWGRAVRVMVEGRPALALSPEDTLLHLCLHQASHALGYILGYLDIHLFVHRVTIDRDLFVQRVVAARLKTAAWFALSFACMLLGTAVPQAVLDALRPSPYRQRLVERFVTPAWLVSSPARALSQQDHSTLSFLLKDRWRDTLRVWLWTVFLPDRPRLQYRYPWASDGLWLAWAYVLHLVRLAAYGVALVRRLLG